MNDRITEDADWKDGINRFRLNVIDQLDGIIKVLESLNEAVKKDNKTNKGKTP